MNTTHAINHQGEVVGRYFKAYEHGALCNVFYADEPEEVQKYLDMGIDCILTNDYLAIKNAVGHRLAKK